MTTRDLLLGAERLDARTAIDLGLRALDERGEHDVLPHIVRVAESTSDPRLLHVLGLLYRALGNLAPALAAFDRALAIDSSDARLVHARAQAAFEAGLPSLAWFSRARALAPNESDVILGQAAALAVEQSGADADTLLTDMLRQHPGWLPGHAALMRLRFSSGTGPFIEELDRALRGAPQDARLHHLKIMALHRAALGEHAVAAATSAHAATPNVPQIAAAVAIVATEYLTLVDADAAFGRVDPLSDPDLLAHWLRHLLRRGEPERVSALAGRMPPSFDATAWPYLSIAWRMLADPRHQWLDDERLVRVVDFGEDWPLLGPLAETLRTLHTQRSQPLDQSVRGGTQTDGQLLVRLDPVLTEMKAALVAEIRAYTDSLPPPDASHPLLGHVPVQPRFVGSWSVRLAEGGFHEAHIHNMGWLSSAFYIELPRSEPGDAGWLILGEPQSSLGLDLPPLRKIEPRRGRLVLFPSNLWHGTRRFNSGERLTVAFDIA